MASLEFLGDLVELDPILIAGPGVPALALPRRHPAGRDDRLREVEAGVGVAKLHQVGRLHRQEVGPVGIRSDDRLAIGGDRPDEGLAGVRNIGGRATPDKPAFLAFDRVGEFVVTDARRRVLRLRARIMRGDAEHDRLALGDPGASDIGHSGLTERRRRAAHQQRCERRRLY